MRWIALVRPTPTDCPCPACRWFRRSGYVEGVSARPGEACQNGIDRDTAKPRRCEVTGCSCLAALGDGECEGCWLWRK